MVKNPGNEAITMFEWAIRWVLGMATADVTNINPTKSWALFLFWPVMWITLAVVTYLYFTKQEKKMLEEIKGGK